jgi:hypothetical protein
MSHKPVAFACVLAAAAVLVPGGLATTAPETLNAVRVTVTDARIKMQRDRFDRGSLAQFYVVNRSAKTQIFKVGREQTRKIRPGKFDVIILHFAVRGRFAVYAIPDAGRRVTAYLRVE